MKSAVYTLSSLSFLLFLLLPTACQKEIVSPDEATQQVIEFEGLQVNHTFDIPYKVLSFEEKDFQTLYLVLVNK